MRILRLRKVTQLYTIPGRSKSRKHRREKGLEANITLWRYFIKKFTSFGSFKPHNKPMWERR